MKTQNSNLKSQKFLSVVIPAFNEEHNLRAGVLDQVNDYLSNKSYTWEVLIVDDGSEDKTAEIAKSYVKNHKKFKFLEEPHRGKGGTVIAGMLAANGEHVLFTDMDQSTPINELEKVFPKFKEGYDIVIGSRVGREGAPTIRKIMAYGFAFLRLIILRLPFRDTQCGFKAFNKRAVEKIFSKMKNLLERKNVHGSSLSAGFDVEILYLARKMGFKVAEVPVNWHYHEGTKKNEIVESWIGFKGILAVRLKSLMGYYKL